MQTTSTASGVEVVEDSRFSTNMLQGQVTTHFPTRGFMFIQQDGDSTPIFAHVSAFLNSEDVEYIVRGMRVRFRLTPGRQGKPCAVDIGILWSNVYNHSDPSRNDRRMIQDMIKKEVQEQCKVMKAEVLKETVEKLLCSLSTCLKKTNDA